MFKQHLLATFSKCLFSNPSFQNIFEMFCIKILSQTFFVPIFSECLLNVNLQTFPNKDGCEQLQEI